MTETLGKGSLSGKRLLLALAVWLGASALAGGLTAAAVHDPGVLSPLIVGEVYALLIAALVVVLRPPARDALALKRFTLGDLALAASACAGAYAVIGALEAIVAPAQWTATVGLLHAIGSDDGRLATAGPAMAFVILLRACVLAPVGEELLFRGALYTWLRGKLPAGVTLAITSAAFALIHGYPLLMAVAFIIGLGLGVVRERSGSTVPLVIAHALNNAVLVILSLQSTGWTARLPQWGT